MALQETLELDVAEALRGVDRVDDALTQAASAFKVALADALDVLRTPAEVTIDGPGLASSVEQAVAGADAVAAVSLDGLDAATASVSDAIDAGVASADTAVTVTATGLDAVTSEVSDAVTSADSTITVQADVEGAAAEIADLGAAADASSASIEGVTTSTRALDVAAGLAAGELGSLKEALPEESSLGGVAAGLAAVAVGATEAFHAADEAEIADARLASTFGDLADSVQQIDVGGLTGDLTALAERAGSSDEALKLSIARLAELGRSGGASDNQIVQVSQDIAALALRLSVVNPTLGEAGDIAARLTTGFARGGRALAPFGLALTAAEINARALADTGKDDAASLNLFEKSAAGAALAVEQLGGNLGPDFQRGTEQTVIGLRSVKEEFQNALEVVGKPLLEPVLEELRRGEPALVDLASIFGELAVDVLPLAASLIGVATPALHGALVVVEDLSPVLQGLVDVVDDIPAPVLATIGVFLALQKAGRLVSPVLSGVQAAVTGLATTSAAGGSAISGVGSALTGLLNPATLALVGVAALVTAVSAHNAKLKEERRHIEEVGEALAKQEKSFRDTISAEADSTTSHKHQNDDLVRLGLTIDNFTDLALKGTGGYERFLDALARGGEISQRGAALLGQLAEQGLSLDQAFEEAQRRGVGLSLTNEGLVRTFVKLQGSASKEAEAALDSAQAHGKFSQAQRDAAVANARVIDGTIDYTKVLGELLPLQVQAADGTVVLGTATDQAALLVQGYAAQLESIRVGTDAIAIAQAKAGPSLGGVIDQFRRGTLTGDDFANVLANTGLTASELGNALTEAKQQTDEFVNGFVQGLPQITGASAELAKDHSLAKFLDSLHQKTLDEARFVDSIVTLERRGATELAKTFDEAGIGAATEARKAATLGDAELARREEQRKADVAVAARKAAELRTIGEQIADDAQHTVDRVGHVKPPDLTRPIKLALGYADSALQHAAHDFEVSGRHLGESIGTGLDLSQPAIFRAAERAGRAAKAGFARELQISSPSKVFLGYGLNAGTSAASGLDASAAQVDAAAVRLARRMVLNLPSAQTTANTAATGPAPTVAGAGVSGVRDIIVNEVANDPVATARAVDAMLGARAGR